MFARNQLDNISAQAVRRLYDYFDDIWSREAEISNKLLKISLLILAQAVCVCILCMSHVSTNSLSNQTAKAGYTQYRGSVCLALWNYGTTHKTYYPSPLMFVCPVLVLHRLFHDQFSRLISVWMWVQEVPTLVLSIVSFRTVFILFPLEQVNRNMCFQ